MPRDSLPPRSPVPVGTRIWPAAATPFVGRARELREIAAVLRAEGPQAVLVAGPDGCGKTALAVEFVQRYGCFFAGGVFWLRCAHAESVRLQVAASAGTPALALPPAVEVLSLVERLDMVLSTWRSAMPRLLVLDDCEDETLLGTWRPSVGGCRVLVTSARLGARWPGVNTLPLGAMSRADSIHVLGGRAPGRSADDGILDAVAGELADAPLALHLAASCLRAHRAPVSPIDYLARVTSAEVRAAAARIAPHVPADVEAVTRAFVLSTAVLQGDGVDRTAKELLAMMAWLAPSEPVPVELLGPGADDSAPPLRDDALARLAELGLLERQAGWLWMHRLVARLVRDDTTDGGARSAVTRVLVESGRAAKTGRLTRLALELVVPHLLEAVAELDHGGVDDDRTLEVCDAAGQTLLRSGDPGTARQMLERSLHVAEGHLGPEDPAVGSRLHDLAIALWAGGDLAAALELLERAEVVCDRAGTMEQVRADILHNRALLLQSRGDLAAAEVQLRRLPDTYSRLYGPDHLATAAAFHNLALLLRRQGDLGSALPLFERALAIWEKAAGPGDPRTAMGLNNLAVLLQSQGELARAKPLLERALAIREGANGPDHPDTATSLHNLGALLWVLGEPVEARHHLERALAVREHLYGAGHPLTRFDLESLAVVQQPPQEDGCDR